MEKRIYVGNLPFSVTQEGLKDLFMKYGNIEEAIVITNKFSGRSKGFGFVTFSMEESVEKAVSEMNKKAIEGREIIVKEAVPFDPDKPRKEFSKKPESDQEEESNEEDAPSEESSE